MGASLNNTYIAISGQVADGTITVPKIATGTPGKFLGWDTGGLPSEVFGNGQALALLETLNPSAVNTITSSALTAYDYYMVLVFIKPSTAADITFRFNGDSGTNYTRLYYNNTTATVEASATSGMLGTLLATNRSSSMFMVTGITPAVASGKVMVQIMPTGTSGNKTGLTAEWTGGNNVQISTITILGTQTFTGQIKIYGGVL